MARVSSGLRRWRAKQKRGAIMKRSTFNRIKNSAAQRGYRNPRAVAGAAYWRTAKAKYRRARRRSR